MRLRLRPALAAPFLLAAFLSAGTGRAADAGEAIPSGTAGLLDRMTGCWLAAGFQPTSLLADPARADAATLVREKMLLRFDRIDGTQYLVLGRIYEWDRQESYVLGPTWQNGLFDPVTERLTFGFPGGGLDRAGLTPSGGMLYIHAKSAADKSAMSVRHLDRIGCDRADRLEAGLKRRQAELR